MTERCPICDRPYVFATAPADDVTCRWSGGSICRDRAVDWRARALAAEALLEELEGLT